MKKKCLYEQEFVKDNQEEKKWKGGKMNLLG